MNFLMHKYKAFIDSNLESRKVFILGCGRSGTHWMGYILKKHRDVYVTIEKKGIFDKVTEMAIDPSRKKHLLKPLIMRYRLEHACVAPRFYVDKSHPNLWLAEDLAQFFPNALFIGIQRDPYGTISSMLKHHGVRNWCQRWEEFPTPNSFLGITEFNIQTYRNLTLAGRCALRWKSHFEKMNDLQKKLGERIYIVQYEQMMLDPTGGAEQLRKFLKLTSPIPKPDVNKDSQNKWRDNLSVENCTEIEKVTGIKPD